MEKNIPSGVTRLVKDAFTRMKTEAKANPWMKGVVEELEPYFGGVISGSDTEKNEYAKKIFDIYRENKNNNYDITLVCSVVLTNILGSMRADTNEEREVFHLVYTIYNFLSGQKEYNYADVTMYILSEMHVTTQLLIICNNLIKIAERAYEIYLSNQEEEYNKAAINCIKILLMDMLCNRYVNNYTNFTQSIEKICNISGHALEKENNKVVIGSLKELLEIIKSHNDLTPEIQREIIEVMYHNICSCALEKGNNKVVIEGLKELSEIVRFYDDILTPEIQIEITGVMYDICSCALESGNNEVVIEGLKELSNIRNSSLVQLEAKTMTIEKAKCLFERILESGKLEMVSAYLEVLDEKRFHNTDDINVIELINLCISKVDDYEKIKNISDKIEKVLGKGSLLEINDRERVELILNNLRERKGRGCLKEFTSSSKTTGLIWWK